MMAQPLSWSALDYALDYARRGFEVFPVPPGTKKSHKKAEFSGGAEWGKTTDPETIRRDFAKWPDANVGLPTGAASGFFAVDLDVKAGGLDNWEQLVRENGPLPATVTVRTPSGGRHYWFQWVEGIRNSASEIAAGVDIRGEGGMVVAPPSVKPGSGAYAFEPGCAPWEVAVAEAPEWVVRAALQASAKAGAPQGSAAQGRSPGGRAKGLGGVEDLPRAPSGTGLGARKVWDREMARLSAAEEGSRNDTLNRVAYTLGGLIPGGHLSFEAVRAALVEVALSLGLDAGELGTIDSGLVAGQQEPFDPRGLDDFRLSDEQLAALMAGTSWGEDHCWVPSLGKWRRWNGAFWETLPDLAVTADVRAFLSKLAAEAGTVAEIEVERERQRILASGAQPGPGVGRQIIEKARLIEFRLGSVKTDIAVETKLRSMKLRTAAEFDSNLLLLGTPDGTVDLQTGELRPSRREDFISRTTGVVPAAPGARAERWEQFLADAQPDPAMRDFLQRLAGYALTGLTREEKIFFFYGGGGNGKGTFLETLYAVMGDYVEKLPAGLLLTQSQSGINVDAHLAKLEGARLAIGSEIERGRSWNESLLKDLTGGDTLVARHLYRDAFDFKPQATVIIAGNTQPSIRGVDDAMRRRMVLVEFGQRFGEGDGAKPADPSLKACLQTDEASAVLRWAVEGARLYLRDGLLLPASVKAASKAYLDNEDLILCFLDEETERGEWVSTAALHHRFTQWLDGQGLKPWGQRTLSKRLREYGLTLTSRDGYAGVRGITLKPGVM